MTEPEREEALRLAKEAGIDAVVCTIKSPLTDCLVRLIHLARAQPQGEPITANSVFCAIQHGDSEHRAWLLEALNAHFSGMPIPSPRSTAPAIPPGYVLVEKAAFSKAYASTPGFVALFLSDHVDNGQSLLREIQALAAAPKPGEKE